MGFHQLLRAFGLCFFLSLICELQVVRVTDSTLKERLIEFQQTDASQLTPDEFETMEMVGCVCYAQCTHTCVPSLIAYFLLRVGLERGGACCC
jgi:hypothetical protein